MAGIQTKRLPKRGDAPIMRPCCTDEVDKDRSDILDLVRKRIAERKLEPKHLRYAGVTCWSPNRHWRLNNEEGLYDGEFSLKLAYQLAAAVGLRRTQNLPFAL